MVTQRNPYYFKVDTEGNQLPYIDEVVFNIVEDDEVMLLQALNGELDLVTDYVNTLDNKAAFFDNQETGNFNFFEQGNEKMNATILSFNQTHTNPVKREIFRNHDFRVGLSHAIDRQAIIDTVYVSQGEPWQAAPSPDSEFYNATLAKQYTEYDVELANEHLDKAFPEKDAQGFRLGPDGKRISVTIEVDEGNTADVDSAALVKANWEAVGVETFVRSFSADLLRTHKQANDFDVMTWAGEGGLAVIGDPRFYMPFSHESDFGVAWALWSDPSLSALINAQPQEPPPAAKKQIELRDELETTADPEEQNALMTEILDIATEQFYAMGLVLPAAEYGVVSNRMGNVPDFMFDAAGSFPDPATYNPAQFYLKSQN